MVTPDAHLLDIPLDTAFQPIIHLGSAAVVAYEALVRPRSQALATPTAYFGRASDEGLRTAAEIAALRASLAHPHTGTGTRRFVNVSPTVLCEPEFDLLAIVAEPGQESPPVGDLVVEVTESEAIVDLDTLVDALHNLRRAGCGLAVDDAGAGHASFRVITALRPDFIKIDAGLVRRVDIDGACHAFLDAMVRFARQIGARLIAEGVETEGQLSALASLGVDAGQGHAIARPVIGELVQPSNLSRRVIARVAQHLRSDTAQVTAGQLVRPAGGLPSGATIRDAHQAFTTDPALSAVAVEGPTGRSRVVTRRAVLEHVATRGTSPDLPIHAVASRPLEVRAGADLLEVGRAMGAGDPLATGDDVVVIDERGRSRGVLLAADVVRALAQQRRMSDHEAHPLTGLRGAAWIQDELAVRHGAGESLTLVVVDVDRFRLVNEQGGFALGDAVVRELGRALAACVAARPSASIAHAGGDDFWILVPTGSTVQLIGELVDAYESKVIPFVRLALRSRRLEDVSPQLTASIAAFDVVGDVPEHQDVIGWARQRLMAAMHVAKEHPGHTAVHLSDGSMATSAWEPINLVERTISVGLAEPAAVMEGLEIIDSAWKAYWTEELGTAGASVDAFPGPIAFVEELFERYGTPIQRSAEAARERGRPVVEVALRGRESDLMEILDRLALIGERHLNARTASIRPGVGLLARLLESRGRSLRRSTVRHDVNEPQDVFELR